MKANFLIWFVVLSCLSATAQDSLSSKKIYRNEFGIDATGFIKQFLNFSESQYPTYYTPTYYLTYRRHFKSSNIRFAVGGDFKNNQIPNAFEGDSSKLYNKAHSIDLRIGYELFNNLSNRWQIFYGLDFRPSIAYSKNDAPYWNGGYANGVESKTEIYAIAPLLGFRFKISNRISLSTESSFSINWEKNNSRKYYIPVSDQYPPKEDEVQNEIKKVYSNFNAPLFIIITFDI